MDSIEYGQNRIWKETWMEKVNIDKNHWILHPDDLMEVYRAYKEYAEFGSLSWPKYLELYEIGYIERHSK